jgi:hydroxymethylpyrimidine pyrophosphatase-like HAD family hydrolase
MSATVSSIHINGWFGDHDKRVGARWIVQALWNRDLDQELQRWAYVGDSTNDQRMFEVFDNSVGVANIRRFLPELVHLPRFVTSPNAAPGFARWWTPCSPRGPRPGRHEGWRSPAGPVRDFRLHLL